MLFEVNAMNHWFGEINTIGTVEWKEGRNALNVGTSKYVSQL